MAAPVHKLAGLALVLAIILSLRGMCMPPLSASQKALASPRVRAGSQNITYLPVILQPPGKTVPIYAEWPAKDNRFAPSGWMGDTRNIVMDLANHTKPHSGQTAIRAYFSPYGKLGWGGVSWQDPRSNWGKQPGGHDLSGAGRLSFWARGERGGEVVEFSIGGIGDSTTAYSDSLQPARVSFPIVLSDTWEKIEIDLAGANLSHLVGGFAWSASRCQNSEPITFYLDDIMFEYYPLTPSAPSQLGRRFYVYDDNESGCTHFAPTGRMGDIEDVDMSLSWTTNPYRGSTAIRATYTGQGSRGEGWAGIMWQEPANNWGKIQGGYDLRWANKLMFRARGERAHETIEFFVGGIGDDSDPYHDSLRPALSTGPISLTLTWQTYTLDLRGRDLSRVIGGFGWATGQSANPPGATFYLDDILFEYDPKMSPSVPVAQFSSSNRVNVALVISRHRD